MTSELMDAVKSLGRALGVPFTTDIDRTAFLAGHRPRREGDEWACNCGRRWGAGEPDPHGN